MLSLIWHQRHKQQKENELDLRKIKFFFRSRDPMNRVKQQPTGGNIAKSHIWWGIKNQNTYGTPKTLQQKPNNAIQKWQKVSDRHFSKEDTWLANKHTKRRSTSLIIRETQTRITRRRHPAPIRTAIIEDNRNECWVGMGKNGPSCTVVEIKNDTGLLAHSVGGARDSISRLWAQALRWVWTIL